MGTYYKVTHDAPSNEIQSSIDSLLLAINQSVSTYIETSVISKINSPGNKVEQVSVLYNGKYIKQQRISMPAIYTFSKTLKKLNKSGGKQMDTLTLRLCPWSTTGVLDIRQRLL